MDEVDVSRITEPAGGEPDLQATKIDFGKPDALVGRKLDGRFLIEKNLTEGGADQGGIGVVYLATDLKLMGKEVVVKILQEAALEHEDIVRKFQHEKEALIRLDHPGIVRILDSGSLRDGNPFMVMEYIKGYSLRKPMREQGPMPLHVVAHIVQCVTDALGAAHAEKILHRDIKPENIMLTPQGDGFDRVRLIDFGIAKVGDSKLAPQTEIGRAIGTVLYIPPEQLIGRLDMTPAADIYATAITTYEMLTGELPFKPNNIAEMYQLERDGVVTRPTELRVDMPREAERILLTALEFDPDKRPQNARFFGQYLARELVKGSGDTDRFFSSIKTEFAKMPTELISSPDLDSVETVQRIKTVKPPGSGWLKWAIPAVLVVGLLTAATLYFTWKNVGPAVKDTPSAAQPTAAPRQLSYFLRVQKMRDGKPFEAPFQSSGQEVFESGYKFQMVFQSQDEGNIYVFNEGVDAQGKPGYFLLFPSPSVNGGSPHVAPAQQIETAQNTLTGGKGTEVMWLIWSKDKADDVEKAVAAAFAKRGTVDDENYPILQSFLQKYASAQRDVTKDTANQQTVIKANGDIVVHRFEIEHR
jgi:serine/threonine-protein kinase